LLHLTSLTIRFTVVSPTPHASIVQQALRNVGIPYHYAVSQSATQLLEFSSQL